MDPSKPVSQPVYTQDEVNEILKRALAQEVGREGALSHEELVDIATEAGIDRQSLDRAMAELAQEHARASVRRDEAAEIAAERRLQFKRFGASLTSYTVLNAFLYFVCERFTGGTWYVWPLLGSGAHLALQLRHIIFPYDKVLRRRKHAERERARERKRMEHAEWTRRMLQNSAGLSDGVKGFETAVQAGVSALLTVAERKLAEHREREQGKHTRPKR